MPGVFTDAGKNAMLAKITGRAVAASASEITSCSIHTAYPPSNANEIAAANGARQAITYDVPLAGVVSDLTLPSFDVPAGTTVSAVAYRSSDGTILAQEDVPDETFTNAGTYAVTGSDLTIANPA